MELIQIINLILGIVFTLCYAYQSLYLAVPWLKQCPKPKNPCRISGNRYAILIAARNEEPVISELINSLCRQTYPKEKITVFVVADNCTDSTAEKARRAGAVVYERFHRTQIGKGYALKYLLDRIRNDCPSDPFDGYFVFDADNIVEETYIEEMDKTFQEGYSILTSYRNSKNYSDNWISAGHSLWFLRESKYLNQARMQLHVNCLVSGTGFLFSREVMWKNDGWNCFFLTEDTEFTIQNMLAGERIGYCPTAVFYDEQPSVLRQSFRQRMRWAKGWLQVIRRYGSQMAVGCVKGNFSCYDHLMSVLPAAVLTLTGAAVNLIGLLLLLLTGQSPLPILEFLGTIIAGAYLPLWFLGTLTTISEWKKICAPPWKKILYTFTFPLYMFTYIPIAVASLFCKVDWKPIKHTKSLNAEQIRGQLEKKITK